MKRINFKLILTSLLLGLSLVLICLPIKGAKSFDYFQNSLDTSIMGPFESSGSSSRYALVESIANDRSFVFNPTLAKLASPDLVEYRGRYFSIFTPGMSFYGLPFYLLGQIFGLAQLFTFSSVTLLAFLNIFLIARLATKLGVNKYLSYLSGLVFALATNSLTYGVTFTQHELSVTLILLALLNSFKERTVINDLIFGGLFGIGLLTDIPNFFLMAPIGIYIFFKHFEKRSLKSTISISFKTTLIGILVGLLPFLTIYGFYNLRTTGSYSKLGQFIGRTAAFNSFQPTVTHGSSNKIVLVNTPFQTRIELSSLYTLLLSDERSWIFYSPVVLFGLLGLYFGLKNNQKKDLVVLISSVVLMNVVLYGMFGDPWGGWSFGPRYLVPAAALLCSSLGLVIQQWGKKNWFILLFLAVLLYSLAVNTLGAITTSLIPPKVEAIHLTQPIPYTYLYNFQVLEKGQSGSLVYNLYLKNYVSSFQYWEIYSASAFLVLLSFYLLFLSTSSKSRREAND